MWTVASREAWAQGVERLSSQAELRPGAHTGFCGRVYSELRIVLGPERQDTSL